MKLYAKLATLLLLWSALLVGCGGEGSQPPPTSDTSYSDTLDGDTTPVTLQSGPEPPIVLTIDLHVDPLPQAAPLEQRREQFRERLGNAEWLLDALEGTGARITFLAGPEFYEYCLEEQEQEDCFAVMQRLFDSGGSLGTHTHQDIRAGGHDWPALPGTASPEQCHQSWADAVEMTNAVITALLGLTETDAIMAVNNIHGSHLPKDDVQYDALMMEFGFSILESGPEEDFYGLYGHHIWNVYRPSPSNWMTEDPNTQYVVVPSGPVIGRVGVHKGIEQDMSVPHVQTMFLQLLANWQHRVATNAPNKVWTYGVAMHAYDIAEGSEVRDAIVEFVDWANAHFVGQTSAEGYPIAQWDGRAPLAETFEAWEQDNPGSAAFQYPSTEKDDTLYPYLLPIATQLRDAKFTNILHLRPGVSAYQFDTNGSSLVMMWADNGSEGTADLSDLFSNEPTATVTDGVTGETTEQPTSAVPVGVVPLIVGEPSDTATPSASQPNAGLCGDGICGPKEKANPDLCPEDCNA